MIGSLVLHNVTAGDISGTLTGHLDATGQDRLRLTGRLLSSLSPESGEMGATVPISVQYE